MYFLNKIVGAIVNPLAIGIILLVAAGLAFYKGRRRLGWWGMCLGVAWFWFWSSGPVVNRIGVSLESAWQETRAEDMPACDAVILLGGGMSAAPDKCIYPNLWSACDRVWYSAQLYKAGKAPLIIPTGYGTADCELVLLRDMGVPESAVRCEEKARNTEENAHFVAEMFADSVVGRRPRVLLVTSALHMRRAKLMYDRYAKELDIVAAPCDFEFTVLHNSPTLLSDFFPSAYALVGANNVFREIIGYWGYRLLRK